MTRLGAGAAEGARGPVPALAARLPRLQMHTRRGDLVAPRAERI